MKAPIKQKQFLISKENGEEWVDNFYILFVGDVPGSVERENLVPGDLKEAKELGNLHDMVATEIGIFEIYIMPVSDFFSITEIPPDRQRVGLVLGTDHKCNVQYFHLPEGSIFKAITIRELCEHHDWGYDELKEATQSIRFCYDL